MLEDSPCRRSRRIIALPRPYACMRIEGRPAVKADRAAVDALRDPSEERARLVVAGGAHRGSGLTAAAAAMSAAVEIRSSPPPRSRRMPTVKMRPRG